MQLRLKESVVGFWLLAMDSRSYGLPKARCVHESVSSAHIKCACGEGQVSDVHCGVQSFILLFNCSVLAPAYSTIG